MGVTGLGRFGVVFGLSDFELKAYMASGSPTVTLSPEPAKCSRSTCNIQEGYALGAERDEELHSSGLC